ncbi:META and DUF4377 domain-containing protein [Cellvibrio japonicus]|nr:META and DUF4377 domain-containing protein [Cellvibrio japonicus]QEI11307.1 DUF4377 domain-containing protein [Cellvibrio japonicus]QEI14881.1 DUF4377 domain-containing protein [Cellvibrio japonicus]QEI18461.1 DUF4377 domain-containing protein [Cellvibrio japonicus]
MRIIPFMLAVLTLAGCAQQVPKSDIDALGKYHWTLVNINERPASTLEARTQLDFSNGQVSVSGLCNNIAGPATIKGSHLKIGPLRSTLKACLDNELSAHEHYFANWLPNVSHWAIRLDSESPVLTLSQDSGEYIHLRGEPTAETRYGSQGDIIFLEIQPLVVPCNHPLIPNYQCLQVREISYNEQGIKTAQGPWQHFYDSIQGYQHRSDTRVILRIKRYPIANPPADGSRFAYIHDLTVEQALVSP